MAFPDDWSHLHIIVIGKDFVAATESNIPILLSSGNFLDHCYANTQAGGQDLRFTIDEAGATEIPLEIVSWDTSGKTGEVWVKIPSLSSSVDTAIYVWYGNPGASPYAPADPYGAENVWPSEYKMVNHMTGASATALDDSTSNSNDVSASSGDPLFDQAGKIGEAVDFDGVGDFLTIPNHSTLSPGSNDFTITLWVRQTARSNAGVLAKYGQFGDREWGFLISSGGDRLLFATNDASRLITSTAFPLNVWTKITCSSSGGIGTLYENTTSTASENMPAPIPGGIPVVVGKWYAELNGVYLIGLVDEIQIIVGKALSADHLSTRYNNENSPATFATAVAVNIATAADGITISDAGAAFATYSASTVDGMSISESQASFASWITASIDGVEISESLTAEELAIFIAQVVDGVRVGEAVETHLDRFAFAIDGVTLSEDIQAFFVSYRSAIDGVRIGETPQVIANFSVSVADGVKMAESMATILAYITQMTDGVILGDFPIIQQDQATGMITISFETKQAKIIFDIKQANPEGCYG